MELFKELILEATINISKDEHYLNHIEDYPFKVFVDEQKESYYPIKHDERWYNYFLYYLGKGKAFEVFCEFKRECYRYCILQKRREDLKNLSYVIKAMFTNLKRKGIVTDLLELFQLIIKNENKGYKELVGNRQMAVKLLVYLNGDPSMFQKKLLIDDSEVWKTYIVKVGGPRGWGKYHKALQIAWSYYSKSIIGEKFKDKISSFSQFIELSFQQLHKDGYCNDYQDLFELLLKRSNSISYIEMQDSYELEDTKEPWVNRILTNIHNFALYGYEDSIPEGFWLTRITKEEGILKFWRKELAPFEKGIKGIMDDGTDLNDIFDQFNKDYFNNELTKIPVRFDVISNLANHHGKIKFKYVFSHGITLNMKYKTCDATGKYMKVVCMCSLLHEMTHRYIMDNYPIYGEYKKHSGHRDRSFRRKLREISDLSKMKHGLLYGYSQFKDAFEELVKDLETHEDVNDGIEETDKE